MKSFHRILIFLSITICAMIVMTNGARARSSKTAPAQVHQRIREKREYDAFDEEKRVPPSSRGAARGKRSNDDDEDSLEKKSWWSDWIEKRIPPGSRGAARSKRIPPGSRGSARQVNKRRLHEADDSHDNDDLAKRIPPGMRGGVKNAMDKRGTILTRVSSTPSGSSFTRLNSMYQAPNNWLGMGGPQNPFESSFEDEVEKRFWEANGVINHYGNPGEELNLHGVHVDQSEFEKRWPTNKSYYKPSSSGHRQKRFRGFKQGYGVNQNQN